MLGGALITGTLFAYFSDLVVGNGTVTAGTLDISGEYKIYVNSSSTAEATNTLSNFNPGDVVVIKATITNDGTKSAWIRDGITLDGTLFGVNVPSTSTSVISVYAGEVAPGDIATSTPLTLTSGSYYSTAAIINGSVESETGGVTTYPSAYTIYFNALADNAAQNQTLSIAAKTQALQYRNNTSTPNDGSWGTVVTAPFTVTLP